MENRMNREAAEKRARQIESDLRRDGLWEKLDSIHVYEHGFEITKVGDHLVIKPEPQQA